MKNTGGFIVILSILMFTGSSRAGTADTTVSLEIPFSWTSNVFLNVDKVQDFVISPGVDFEVDFDPFLSAGYSGRLNIFSMNTDLINHGHSVHFLVNPAWRKDVETELIARATLTTNRFLQAWANLNNLRPMFDSAVSVQPVQWFRWYFGTSLSHTWFYDDPKTDYMDFFVKSSFQFTFQTRTTLTPRFAYGLRWYAHRGPTGTTDRTDHSIDVGLHFSQGLWKNAGLQADYSWTKSFGISGLIERNREVPDFSYLEEDFLFSGHHALLGLKQLIGDDWSLRILVDFESRDYAGWVAIDGSGALSGGDRSDFRLGPNVEIEYAFNPSEDAPSRVPAVTLNLGYRYMRQWSSHAWYDTDRHVLSVGVVLDW